MRKQKLDDHQKMQVGMLELKNRGVAKKIDLQDYISKVQNMQEKYDFENPVDLKKAEEGDVDPNERQMIQSRKAYYRELKKVLEESDVVIQVLDARDPMGCRNAEVEQETLKQGKKVLLVLNKIDLVPPQNARMWQKYLRQEFPCVLFKANQQKQHNLGGGFSLHKSSMIDKADMVEQMVS